MHTETEIKKIIENGENSYIEFKDDRVDNLKLAKEMVALSNHKGGKIILGVADNKNIINLSRTDNEERVMNIATESIKPRIVPSYYELKIDDKKIAVIEIDNGLNKPYYIEQEAIIEGKKKRIKMYYNRYGSLTKEITERDELQRLFQSSQNIHFELVPCKNAEINDINSEKLHDYLFQFRNGLDTYLLKSDDYEMLLHNLELTQRVENKYCPTIAGILLFGKTEINNNRIKKYLPQSGVTVAVIAGTHIADDKIDYKFFEKDIFSNIEDTLSFFRIHNKRSFTINGMKRVDIYDYPESAFREILINAFVHRDYTIAGSDIRIFIYLDRIEIHSPGKIPNTLSIDRMRLGMKYYRNPVIMQYLCDANYVEKMGQGIPNSIKALKENGNPDLDIKEIGDALIVTMYKKMKK